MKKFILWFNLLLAASAGAQVTWQEASTAQVTAGTAGAPYAITPRRLAAAIAASGGLTNGGSSQFSTTSWNYATNKIAIVWSNGVPMFSMTGGNLNIDHPVGGAMLRMNTDGLQILADHTFFNNLLQGGLYLDGNSEVQSSTNINMASGDLFFGGTTRIDWANSQIFDSSLVQSIAWGDRILTDSSGADSVHWQDRNLVDSGGETSISWQSRVGNDSGGNVSINWDDRQLLGSSGEGHVNWSGATVGIRAASGTMVYPHEAAGVVTWTISP